MELAPGAGRLVLTSGKTVAFVPAAPGGAPAHTLTLPYAPSSASVHPRLQDRFVTGSTADEWVRVHGMDGAERELLKGHHGPVHCVEFSPDGEMFASGSGASPRPPAPRTTLTSPQRTVRPAAARAQRARALMRVLLLLRRDDPALADDAREDVRALAGRRVKRRRRWRRRRRGLSGGGGGGSNGKLTLCTVYCTMRRPEFPTEMAGLTRARVLFAQHRRIRRTVLCGEPPQPVRYSSDRRLRATLARTFQNYIVNGILSRAQRLHISEAAGPISADEVGSAGLLLMREGQLHRSCAVVLFKMTPFALGCAVAPAFLSLPPRPPPRADVGPRPAARQ
jgi:hypothetical protein